VIEALWSRTWVERIEITMAEDFDVADRGSFYDSVGTVRDVVQNHLMQVLAYLTMEAPSSDAAGPQRDEKHRLLQAVRTLDPAEVVRGQYTGYLDTPGVAAGSTTETYVALTLHIDNWRWAGVPFYVRHGKRLARKTTEIAVVLKPVPHLAFQQEGSLGVEPNQLILAVQPNEGVSLSLVAKIPGARMSVRPVNMEFLYGTSFMSQSPEAYERLILDTMRGDATLFARNDEVEAAWAICDPILEAWSQQQDSLPQYEAGSAPPEEANEILLPGQRWRSI
jgi:glucose-6-phosphate 1-dehydrogenase